MPPESEPGGAQLAFRSPGRVLTAEQQAAMSPADVIAHLVEGNARFQAGTLTDWEYAQQRADAVAGQHPMAVVLSCVDSRVPVETVFDCGIGDLFVIRVAGNIVNSDILGSMEFACRLAGAKAVVVLGHQHCGAVKGAIGGAELGHLTGLLHRIGPAIDATSGFDGARTPANPAFVQAVAERNVTLALQRIRAESPVLAEMERTNAIAIVGAMYHLDGGLVTALS